jgi:hypothetical protein
MSDGSYDSDGTNTWMQPRFVLAAVVVALIAVFAVVLTITGPADSNDRDPTPRANSATPSAELDPAGDSDSACGLEAGDQTIPVTAPADTDWELVGTVAAPTAPDTIGPGVVDDGLRSCFTHSPTGALYAAVNIVALTTVAEQREAIARDLAVPGPGRDKALELLAGTSDDPGASPTFQVAGYTFLNYDETSTVVDLALRGASGAVVHLPVALRWQDGDWKVIVPPNGDLASGVQAVPDLTGYVPWVGA